MFNENPILRYYNPNNELTLDRYGIGSIHPQDGYPLGYHSRTPNPSVNYTEIKKEMFDIA